MDIGSTDPEDLADGWRGARREWDRVNQRRLETEAAGRRLDGEEQATWLAAKSRFEEYERAWDQAYGLGVTIVAADDDEDELP